MMWFPTIRSPTLAPRTRFLLPGGLRGNRALAPAPASLYRTADFSGPCDEYVRQKSEPDPGRHRRMGSRHRHGSPCPGDVEREAVLRRIDRIWRRAEFARVAR